MTAARVWLFDLDNTLHDATPHIFPHINRSMREYIERHLGLGTDAATRLRQDYWIRYGATLLGLVRHHGTDPQHFLRETHRFPNLAHCIVFQKSTLRVLQRLPGRKLIFSNAPRHYTESILEITGLARHFDAVYTIESLRFQPKPSLAGFRALLQAERLTPARCILVEDTLANLVTAKKLGMKTIWIHPQSTRHSPSVDLKIRSLLELPQRLGQL